MKTTLTVLWFSAQALGWICTVLAPFALMYLVFSMPDPPMYVGGMITEPGPEPPWQETLPAFLILFVGVANALIHFMNEAERERERKKEKKRLKRMRERGFNV